MTSFKQSVMCNML